MDAATVHHIGLNGLAELKQMDSRFAPFERTLFSSAAPRDRDAETAEANERIDRSIGLFLRLLCPYFLLK